MSSAHGRTKSDGAAALAPAGACGGRRRALQTLAVLLLVLGALSMVARVADLSAATTSLGDSNAGLSVRGSVRHPGYEKKHPNGRASAGGNATSVSASGLENVTTLDALVPASSSLTPTPEVTATAETASEMSAKLEEEQEAEEAAEIDALAHVVQRTRAPYEYVNQPTKKKCYDERDVGIITAVQMSARAFCSNGGWDTAKQGPVSREKGTRVTLYRAHGGIKSATLQNLMIDLTDAKIHAPIENMAQDGGSHDPRFNFNAHMINCGCDELATHYRSLPDDKSRKDQTIWRPALMNLDDDEGMHMSTMCAPKKSARKDASAWDFLESPTSPPDPDNTVVFEDPVVLIARRDDHNPFFQISYALNSWIMLQALDWDVQKTRVLHFDAGYPSPIDALHRGLLAPNHEIVDGADLMGKRLHFRNEVLVAPYELSGPMMQHLDDDEPCWDSELFKSFRQHSMAAVNVTPAVERELAVTALRPMMVTVITRRPYDGRTLQRVWLNEDEIMDNMRLEYKGLNVEFRSVDYVDFTLEQQVRTTVESDMILGMHGAGMVNVLWTRPTTTVVEIFPKERRRWGYRNLCQFTGCNWHDFRGGEDVGDNPVPNTKDKRIPYDEWMAFFHPIFRDAYADFEEQQELLRQAAGP